jgi:uncharacterized phage infection (PIP) family protein YhgE
MAMKDFWSNTGDWIRSHKPTGSSKFKPEIDEDGLISQEEEEEEKTDMAEEKVEQAEPENEKVLVKAVAPAEEVETLDKPQEGFGKLIGQLQDINEHLSGQIAQQEKLTGRMEQMPKLLESFPSVLENQRQMTEKLLEQLKVAAAKNQQFVDVIEKIPSETSKQTDALVDINHQLAAAADSDVQRTESFNKFHQSLDKLSETSQAQTDSIMQMSRTFYTSDRYLKYIVSRQNKRFIWVYVISLSVCVAVILVLAGVVFYLRR